MLYRLRPVETNGNQKWIFYGLYFETSFRGIERLPMTHGCTDGCRVAEVVINGFSYGAGRFLILELSVKLPQ